MGRRGPWNRGTDFISTKGKGRISKSVKKQQKRAFTRHLCLFVTATPGRWRSKETITRGENDLANSLSGKGQLINLRAPKSSARKWRSFGAPVFLQWGEQIPLGPQKIQEHLKTTAAIGRRHSLQRKNSPKPPFIRGWVDRGDAWGPLRISKSCPMGCSDQIIRTRKKGFLQQKRTLVEKAGHSRRRSAKGKWGRK